MRMPSKTSGRPKIAPNSVKFARDMEREGVDHIHAHFANHPAAAGTIITQLTGIPFSFTAHGSDLHKERRMLRQKVEASAFVAAISQYNQAMIVRECGEHVRGKVHVLHCGIDPAMFVPARHEHREGPLRIITVGSLIEVKGHRHLIEACAILRRRGIDVECTFIGEGKLRRKLEKLANRLGVGTVVRFLGGKPRQEVARMLQESDLAVLTSVQTKDGKREGIPVVLMEAMASGLPVVASWISGVPELVDNGRTGLLVPPRDPGGIANAIERLSRDPALRKEMGAAGREKILREFAVERNARLLLETIENVQDRNACQAQGVAV
jgi:glycosyltransferase involved in cell wall biosynthesis